MRHDAHAGTQALKALRMIVSLAATRDGKHRPRSIVLYGIVAAFVHASIDEVVGLLERGECFLLLKALCGTRMASKRWQQHYMRVLRTHGWSASKVMPRIFHHRDPAGTCGCHGDDSTAEGSDALLDRLNRLMKDEFDAEMLGRVGRGHLTEFKFLKRTLRRHEPRGAKNSIPQIRWFGSGNTSISKAEEQWVAVRKSERMLQQRLDTRCEQDLWSTTRLGCKSCTDTDWACEKKQPSAHDDDWTDLV